ncbi:IclR family transcriptional regulator [Pseudacidovorax sp. RU35E]|uniref:IclR family transcriptional regulator n=1 Tax=Pseudacidovorax sp. RU35E TaxID=1907403 RepID=UPI000956F412|nr:IclR family transcriptional regulator [Pseudacidovorax sp. RU35E]SIR08055.1 transcriptional regulator, IclR family [Pseudacidovorax sp. RU35E]
MPGSESATAPTTGAQSVRRALAVLRIVAAGQEHGVRLLDVAQATGLNRATVHRLLQVLVEEGAVEQDAATRRYLIGGEVSLMGLARSAGFPLRAVAAPHLQALAEAEGETCFLTIRNGDDSVCLARHPGSYVVKVLSIEVGARRPLGVGVSGLVLLGGLSDDERADTIARNARRLRALRIEPEELRQRLRLLQRRGHAYAPVGVVPGTRALAVPVRHPEGQILAGLAITAIRERLPDERVPKLVQAMERHARLIGQQWAQREQARRR